MIVQSTYLQAAYAVDENACFIPAARRTIFELYISYLHYRNVVCLLREQLHDNSIPKAKHADIQHHKNNCQKYGHQNGHKCNLIISSIASTPQFMTSRVITPITCNTNAPKAHTVANTEDLQKKRPQAEALMEEVEQTNLDHHAFSANEELTSELHLQQEQEHTHQEEEEEFLQEVQMTEESRQLLSTSFSQRNVLTTELDASYLFSSSELSTTPTMTTSLPELHQVQRSRNERISQWYYDAESEFDDDYDEHDEDHREEAVLFDTNKNVIRKSALVAPHHASLRASCAITSEIKEAIEGNVSELGKAMSQFSHTTDFAQVQHNSFLSSFQSQRTPNSDENVISNNNGNSRNVSIPLTQRRDMGNYVTVELEASNAHRTSPYDLRYALDDYGDVFFIEHALLFPLQEERENVNTPSCASPSWEPTSNITNLEESVQEDTHAKELELNKQEQEHNEEELEEEEYEEELAEWEREEREMHNEHITNNTIAAKDMTEIKESKNNSVNAIDKDYFSSGRCTHVAGNTSGSCLALTQRQQSTLLELLTLADFMGDDHLTRLCAHYLSCWLMQSTENEIIESFCEHNGVKQIPVDVNLTLFSEPNYFVNNQFYNNNINKERTNWNVYDRSTNNFFTTNKQKNNSYTYQRAHNFNKHEKNNTTSRTPSVFHTAKHLTCPLMYAEQKTASEVITSPSIHCTYDIADANNYKTLRKSINECELGNEHDESQHTKRFWTLPWVTRAALLRQTQQSNMGNKDNDL